MATEIVPAQGTELAEIELEGFSISSALVRAEIDAQVATAKRFPRSIYKAKKELETLACENIEIAKECTYSLPRGGKQILGPSVRFAEMVAYSFGNLRTSVEISREEEKFIVARAMCVDLERNNGVQIEVRRRITYANGNRFDDDMINMTANAASSIAFRNAVFRVVPTVFTDPAWQQSRIVALGKSGDVSADRLEWFNFWTVTKRVNKEDYLRALGIKGIDDMTVEHFEIQFGWQTAIKDGTTTIDAIFAPPPSIEQSASKSDRLAGNLKKLKEQATQPAPEPAGNGATREPGQEG